MSIGTGTVERSNVSSSLGLGHTFRYDIMIAETTRKTRTTRTTTTNHDETSSVTMIMMDDVFRLPLHPPPVVPTLALSTPLPEPVLLPTLPLPLPHEPQQLQQQDNVWETKCRDSVRELRLTRERLQWTLQRLEDCQRTISQLEGLVRSLKGVVLHLDPVQGAAILDHEIAAMEEMILVHGRKTTTEGNENTTATSSPLDAYVYRERLESTTMLDSNKKGSLPSSSSSASILLEPNSEGIDPVPLYPRYDQGRRFVSTPSTHPQRVARISQNKSPQESIIEDAVRRQMLQQEIKPDAVGGAHTTSQSSNINGNNSSSSSLVWGMLEQLTGQTLGILSSSASSSSVLASTTHETSHNININNLERDVETMERELNMPVGRPKTLRSNVLPSPKKPYARIETISTYPCDQELMIQEALMKKKRREEEKARLPSNSDIESRPNMESSSSFKSFVGFNSEADTTTRMSPQSVPRRTRQDPRIATLSPFPSEQEIMIQQALKRRGEDPRRRNDGGGNSTRVAAAEPLSKGTVGSTKQRGVGGGMGSRMDRPANAPPGEKRQDPRIMTISHHPSDQEIMIQKALKRREEEQSKLQKSSSSSTVLLEPTGGDTIVPVSVHNQNEKGRRFVSTPSSHPQKAMISQNRSPQESMIDDAVRRQKQQQQQQQQGAVTADIPHSSGGNGSSSSRSLVWGMLEQLTGQTLSIFSSSASSPVSASTTHDSSNSPEREAKALGEKRQDPRIMTISHHPSDQEIMIQKALKRRKEEQMRSTTTKADPT
jgi:hypothetical protein